MRKEAMNQPERGLLQECRDILDDDLRDTGKYVDRDWSNLLDRIDAALGEPAAPVEPDLYPKYTYEKAMAYAKRMGLPTDFPAPSPRPAGESQEGLADELEGQTMSIQYPDKYMAIPVGLFKRAIAALRLASTP